MGKHRRRHVPYTNRPTPPARPDLRLVFELVGMRVDWSYESRNGSGGGNMNGSLRDAFEEALADIAMDAEGA